MTAFATISAATKPCKMSSFAELKALRAAKGGTVAEASDDAHMKCTGESSSAASTSNESTASCSNTNHPSSSQNHYSATISPKSRMYGLNTDLVEIRQTAASGRGLYAKKRISPSTVIMSRKPHVALLDKHHLQELCANCMMDKPGVELRRCSGCQAVRYCSIECQRAQWKAHLHKLECSKLRLWAEGARKAGRPPEEQIPDTPVRAIGNLLLLKQHMPAEWWSEIDVMAGSPRTLSPHEQERLGLLALAITQYIGGDQSTLSQVYPEYQDDHKALTRSLLNTIDKFGINSFSLTQPDLTNIGVAINPSIALVNHSCTPNCAVTLPDGPRGEMKVVAFRAIEEGEEILSSYLDLTLPTFKRQEELLDQYKFECACPACEEGKKGNDARMSVECPKNSKKGAGACSGYVPLPGRAELLGTKELSCNVCGTSRLVQLHDTEKPEAGISHLIRSGEELLSSLGKQEPSIERVQVEKLLQLSKKHHLNPYSYPLLALNRHAFTDSLELAVSSMSTGKKGSYTEARRLCKEIIAGLEKIYAPGHPVLAVQQGILARLLLNNVNGEALTSIEDMRIAWEQCKIAREKMEIAFGKNKDKGVLVKSMERELELLERDMNWRGMAQARIAAR